MSYILDALRRADAERSQSAGSLPSDLAEPGPRPWPSPRPAVARWAVVALSALALAGALWWLARPTPAPAPGPAAGQAAPAAAPSLPTAGAAPPQEGVAPAAAVPPSNSSPPSLPSPPLQTTQPAMATAALQVAQAAQMAQAATPTPANEPGRAPGEAPTAIDPSASLAPSFVGGPAEPILAPQPAPRALQEGRPPGPAGLAAPNLNPPPAPPPALTNPAPVSAPVTPTAGSAPALKVTGSTYSDNPAHRMLIINGRVVLEGQEVEPGLTLEVITPRSAVLNQRGTRFNINY